MSDVEIISLPSRFDYSFNRQFSDLYAPLLDDNNCREIILDFGLVQYLDSSALGMMVLLKKKFEGPDRKVKIKGARGTTTEILKVANMQKLFEFVS